MEVFLIDQNIGLSAIAGIVVIVGLLSKTLNSDSLRRVTREPLTVFIVWILTGILFALLYVTLDSFSSASFNSEFYLNSDGIIEQLFNYFYFSFVSLATVGYGDFSPQTSIARAAVIFESMIGMLTVVVLAVAMANKAADAANRFYFSEIVVTRKNRYVNISVFLEGRSPFIESCALNLITIHQVSVYHSQSYTVHQEVFSSVYNKLIVLKLEAIKLQRHIRLDGATYINVITSSAGASQEMFILLDDRELLALLYSKHLGIPTTVSMSGLEKGRTLYRKPSLYL